MNFFAAIVSKLRWTRPLKGGTATGPGATGAPTRIDTYSQFKHSIVEQDFQEFMADRGNLRKAWHCAGSLFHLHDWVYAAHKLAIDAKYTFLDDTGQTRRVSSSVHFANSLGQAHPDFQLIRGIANVSKHFALYSVPPGRVNPPGMPSHAANTYVSGMSSNPACFKAMRSRLAL